jgi:acyl-[acyl-carrier-protein] desaturase
MGRLAFGSPDQWLVLQGLEGLVKDEINAHLARRKLWFPNDHLPSDEQGGDTQEQFYTGLRERARGLPDAVRVSLALNLLTEEGLPHFHRLIAQYFGNESPWGSWNNLWTAEEDRHGCLLRDYCRDSRLFHMGELEKLQYAYLEAGFNPDWQQDPYRLLAYTSLQEKATQVSHANTGKRAAAHEPTLQRVLAHIAGDESRHYLFYRAAFAGILAADTNRALDSLLKVMPNLAMPGHSVPGYNDMSELIRRQDIFGPRQYAGICQELLEFWGIAGLTGLSAQGQACQDKLMNIPNRLSKLADYADSKAQAKIFAFPITYQREIAA